MYDHQAQSVLVKEVVKVTNLRSIRYTSALYLDEYYSLCVFKTILHKLARCN